jgi:hypothetical protein
MADPQVVRRRASGTFMCKKQAVRRAQSTGENQSLALIVHSDDERMNSGNLMNLWGADWKSSQALFAHNFERFLQNRDHFRQRIGASPTQGRQSFPRTRRRLDNKRHSRGK